MNYFVIPSEARDLLLIFCGPMKNRPLTAFGTTVVEIAK